jgi:ABC-type uncharacterized transport system substrate-binding protein
MWIAAAVLALLHAAPGHAHPHVFVQYSVVLPVGPQGIDGLGFVFVFDAQFSAMIRYSTQSGTPGTASEGHARVLRQLPYEIEVRYNGVSVELDESTDLEVTETGGEFTYRFRVPLRAPLSPPGAIEFSVKDHGMFVAFAPRPSVPVEVQSSGGETATCDRPATPSGAPGPLRCLYGAAPR